MRLYVSDAYFFSIRIPHSKRFEIMMVFQDDGLVQVGVTDKNCRNLRKCVSGQGATNMKSVPWFASKNRAWFL